jgi:D-glycero-alpha-D-manno-heptose-7-phosphate kinase
MQRIISQTPLRISLFGGSTDYPAYYLRKPGATLGMTIDKYTYVSLNPISPFFDHKLRISYSKIELVKSIEEIQHPSVKGCLRHKQLFTPLDIHISADLPAKTGLGSSSAFTVGFLNALYALQGIKISKHRLAEEACHIEQNVIGENVGSQDQYHAAFGGMNIFEFYPSKVKVRPVIISPAKKRAFENHLLMFYTGLTRYADEVVKEQLKKTASLDNDEYLERMYEMVFEAEEMISSAGVEELPKLLGHLLHENWSLKKRLSSQISNPMIDGCYETAMACGAYGGKLCGAGGGGFLVFFAPLDAIPRIREGLKDLLEVEFLLEAQGSSIIYMKE